MTQWTLGHLHLAGASNQHSMFLNRPALVRKYTVYTVFISDHIFSSLEFYNWCNQFSTYSSQMEKSSSNIIPDVWLILDIFPRSRFVLTFWSFEVLAAAKRVNGIKQIMNEHSCHFNFKRTPSQMRECASRIHQHTTPQKVVRLENSSKYSSSKGGRSLQFINIQPPKRGSTSTIFPSKGVRLRFH